jgi:hypothetical protein
LRREASSRSANESAQEANDGWVARADPKHASTASSYSGVLVRSDSYVRPGGLRGDDSSADKKRQKVLPSSVVVRVEDERIALLAQEQFGHTYGQG